LTELCNL